MQPDEFLSDAVAFCAQNAVWTEPESEGLLRPGLSVKEYFRLLLANDCVMDANRVLAHALPKRHALWWGLLCTWEAVQPSVPENVAEVLAAVARFVIEPGENRRRRVEELADLVRPDSGAFCLALGAFLSGGSMARLGLPEVLPKSFLTGRLVGVAVYLAAVARKPLRYKDRLRNFLTLGLDVVRRPAPWAIPGAWAVPADGAAHVSFPWAPIGTASST